ncbi:MAG: ParB/RepB/Spo0J family partition protein [Elusimicrobiota bacterium]
MKKVLGKGLDSLIPEDEDRGFKEIKIENIVPNRYQMRENFDQEKIEELSSTIKDKGIVQPLIVTGTDSGYMLIAGERRLRAAKKAGLKSVPCIERDLEEEDSLIVSLIENIQREELSPIEEASAYKMMVEDFSMTQKQIASQVGKSRSSVANAIRILGLPRDLKKLVNEGKLTSGHARALLSVKEPKKRRALANKIVREKLTVREAEKLASDTKKTKKRKRGSKTTKDPHVEAMEEKLKKSLGTKVKIKINSGSKDTGGNIKIEFYDIDDFERITDILCQN